MSWQSMAVPTGRRVNALAINSSNPSVLFAATDAGIFLNRDGGDSWVESNSGLSSEQEILTITISSSDPNLFFAGGTRGLHRSSDGSQSWHRVGPELPAELITSIALVPQDARTLFVSTATAIYKSTNAGDNWKAIVSPALAAIKFSAVAVDPTQPQTVYIGGDSGALYRSNDSGTSWHAANQGIASNARIQRIAIHPQSNGLAFATTNRGLFRTLNGGAVWTQVGGSQCPGAVLAFDFDRANPSTVYVSLADGGICRGVENGEQWALLNGWPANVPISSLVVDARTPSQIFIAGGSDIYGTRDGGSHWSQLSNGLGATILWLNALPGKSAAVLAGMRGKLLRLANNANLAWEAVSGSFDNTYALSIAVDPQNRLHLFAGTVAGEIYQSVDSGAHWQRISNALANNGEVTTLAAFASAGNTSAPVLYAGTSNAGVSISRDGGVNWSPLNDGLNNLTVSELYAAPGGALNLFAGTPKGLYHLIANSRWQPVSNLSEVAINALTIDPQNPNIIYISTPSGLFKSTNSGDKFSALSAASLDSTRISALLINPRRSNIIYAGTLSGLFRSADSGQTWLAANEGLPPQSPVDHIAINPDEPTILYVSARNHGIYRAEDAEPIAAAPPETVNIPVDWFIMAVGALAIAVFSSGAIAVAHRRHSINSAQIIEQQWPEIRQQIEKGLLVKGEFERDELTTLAPDLRFRALQRYLDEHPAQLITLELDPPLIKLSDSMPIQKFFRNWNITLRGTETGGDLALALTRITTQLCNLLGFTLLDSRRYKNYYGYVVQAPALRLRIPPRFPIIYLPLAAVQTNIATELQDLLGVLHMNSYFALLVILSDAPDAEVKQTLLKARNESIPDFIVLDGQSLSSLLMARDPERTLIDLILDQVELTVVSPYVIAGPVAENMFFGRERELKTITRTVRDRNFAIVGGRKIGKTSVLGKVYRVLASTAGYHPLYLDCQAVQDYESFLDTISTMWEVELHGTAPDALRRFLHDLKAEQGERVVVLLLDEVDSLLQYDMLHRESLFRVLRAAAQEGYCRFVFCGEKTLDAGLHNPASALFNFCDVVHIGFVEPRDARRIIQEPLAEMGIEIEGASELIENIVKLSACHPNIIQYICQQLIAEINQRHTRRITFRDFETVSQSSALHDYFIEVTWGNSSALERLLTLCIIEAGGSMKERALPEATYKQGVRVARHDMRRALDNLELYSILRKAGDEYHLVSYSFPTIIQQTQDIKSLVRSLVSNVYRNVWEQEGMPQ